MIRKTRTTLNITIALVWLVNGLFCKIVNLVPRHEAIVAKILGTTHAHVLTQFIGFLEVIMFLWIVSRIRPKTCAIAQIAVVLTMNCIEFYLVPEWLLFGQFNLLFAVLFSMLIYMNAFFIPKIKSHV